MEREKVITLLRLVKENGLKIDIAADEICSLFSVSGSFLKNYQYYPENEGIAKTFRNVVTEKWYYESELCDVIGITNVEYLKSNYR